MVCMSHHVIPLRARCLANFAFLLVAATLVPGSAAAATLPAGFVESTVADGLVHPTAMAIAKDARIFVADQGGRLRVLKNGQLLAKPFVTLNVNTQGERGLLGVALHPDFPRTPYVYLYYTAVKPKLHSRLSRFTAKGDR